MLVPISWLKEYVNLNLSVQQLADQITRTGIEVENIEHVGESWDPETILVGQVVAVKTHPNAERLVIVSINYASTRTEEIVTGAPNLFQYKNQEQLPVLKVAFALAGAELIDAYSDARPRPKKKLKSSKIRGVVSNGMVCSERELGLSDEHEGILLLPDDAPVGMPLRDYYGDEVLELGLTPDMARCLCMIGVAREISALTGVKLHLPADEIPPTNDERDISEYVRINIETPELCNRYTGMLIRDVQINESLREIQRPLIKAGVRSINNVVDITNYVMLEWGQPLHAFDYDSLVERAQKTGQDKPTLIVRRARAGEKIVTLDSVERELDESMLLITDTAGPIAIAGVMGGAETQVHAGTRNILLEAATFYGINIRGTSQKLKLYSDASQRFARGIPATLNPIAARRAAALMEQHANGKIVPGMADTYPVPQVQRIVYTTQSDMRRLLGIPVSLQEITAALQKLDIIVEQYSTLPAPSAELENSTFGLRIEPGEPLLCCKIPWFRLDLQIPADLTEEVERMVGSKYIQQAPIDDALPTRHRNLLHETEEKCRDILISCGLQENINHTLTNPENHAKLQLRQNGDIEGNAPFITLVNPLSVKKRVMRRSMLVSALESLEYNYRYTQRFAVFEIGRVYLPEKGKDVRPYEEPRLCILLTGSRRLSSVYPDPTGLEAFDFFDLKGVVETLLDRLGLATEEYEFVAHQNPATFTSFCVELKIHGKSQGILGELQPLIQAEFGVPTTARVFIADIGVTSLIKDSWKQRSMEKISNYPSVVEDVAFIIPEEVTAQQLKEAIHLAGGSLLRRLELFDIYRGESIPAQHKSLAFKLIYESLDSNLRNEQVTAIRNRIIQKVGATVGGVLRE